MRRRHNEQDRTENQNTHSAGTHGNAGGKWSYLLVGGGIGAVLALLFAPKSGNELRNDIADATRKGVDRTRETANQLGQKSNEYISNAKQRAGDIYSRTGGALNAAKSEFGKKSGAENERSFGELPSGAHDATSSTVTSRDENDDLPIA